MLLSLAIAVSGAIQRHGMPEQGMMPTPSATPTALPTDVPIEGTRLYTFSKASQLKDFKQSGYGSVSISSNHRMKIVSEPASAKRVSLTVTVDGGSQISWDDAQSGDVGYDSVTVIIDGTAVKNVSGTTDGSAKYQVYPLSAGVHTIIWQYHTDSTFNLPTDVYYVDNIKITHVFTKAYLKG